MYFSCRYIYPISLYLLYQIYLKDTFKEKLDMFLKDIPDCPMTQDLTPDPINRLSCKNSNSLFDWITERRLEVVCSDEPCRIEF